ncbi:MAG: ABC transporter ATP-binding protein [Elainellaceae cyanobacterium]
MTAQLRKNQKLSHQGELQQSLSGDQAAIAASNVSMSFEVGDQTRTVLDQVSLSVAAGKIQLLMGPSGSGKTTLLSILGGILTPSSGRVRIFGNDITQMSRSQLASFRLLNIGFIFQGFNLFPALTAAENIEVVLKMQGKHAHSRRKAYDLLEQVELAHRADAYPRSLSGGQKQRVAIARALAGQPPIVMADEPTASLDSKSGYAVISLLRRLAKEDGTTVLIVTHDPRIQDVADDVAYLEDGRLGERGDISLTAP